MTKQASVAGLLKEKIRSGDFPVGSRLPSLRQLARELDVNPNTVAKVFRDLAAEGTLSTQQGRGTFVLAVPQPPRPVNSVEELDDDLLRVAARALAIGVESEALLEGLRDAIRRTYQSASPRVLFVECNPYDTAELAKYVRGLLQVNVEPLLLQNLVADPTAYILDTDLFITTPYHIDEVESVVGFDWNVISVSTTPAASTLVELSRIARNTRVAAVATNNRTLEQLTRMIRINARMDPAITCLVGAPDLETRLANADVIVGNQSIQDRLVEITAEKRHLIVHYRLEANSGQFLVERFGDLFPRRSVLRQ